MRAARPAPNIWLTPYASLGDYDNAMRWIEKGYDDHDFGIFCSDDPALPAGLKNTVRWRALWSGQPFRKSHVRARKSSRATAEFSFLDSFPNPLAPLSAARLAGIVNAIRLGLWH